MPVIRCTRTGRPVSRPHRVPALHAGYLWEWTSGGCGYVPLLLPLLRLMSKETSLATPASASNPATPPTMAALMVAEERAGVPVTLAGMQRISDAW
jgi:hypothetical protein